MLVGALSLGCAGGGEGGTTGDTGAGTTGPVIEASTTGVPTTGGASVSTSGSSTTGGFETCGFICDPETGGPTGPGCDVFAQDCPEGEKCAPYAEGGGSTWNAVKCVPVLGTGRPGEPCTAAGGGRDGIDDCEEGALCWNVDDMNHGVCVEQCQGSEANPVCDDEDKFNCAITASGVINLCFLDCDPLLQDCPGDDLCLIFGYEFLCLVDRSGEEGQLFDGCEFVTACDKGLICLNPAAATECDLNAGGCCLPFCDFSDPNAACPGVGLSCVSLYEEGITPPKYKDVGICVLPE